MKFTEFADDDEVTPLELAQRAAAASRGTWTSVGVNLAMSSVQIGVGLFARSQSLIADGIHSLSDLVSDFVVLFARRHSRKDAEAGHDIAVEARKRVMQRHRVLNLMTHVDPQHRPDLDHQAVAVSVRASADGGRSGPVAS